MYFLILFIFIVHLEVKFRLGNGHRTVYHITGRYKFRGSGHRYWTCNIHIAITCVCLVLVENYFCDVMFKKNAVLYIIMITVFVVTFLYQSNVVDLLQGLNKSEYTVLRIRRYFCFFLICVSVKLKELNEKCEASCANS